MKEVREIEDYYKYLLLKSRGVKVKFIGDDSVYIPSDNLERNVDSVHQVGIQPTLQSTEHSNRKKTFLDFHNKFKGK